MVTGVGFDVFIISKNIFAFSGCLLSKKYLEFAASFLAGTISPLCANFSLLCVDDR